MMTGYTKPLPYPDRDAQPYWDFAKRHELRMQHCAECRTPRFPPRPMCPQCQSPRDEWVRMAGTGTVYSWIVVHPPVLPAFADDAPYAVVLVQLDDDPTLRLVGTVSDVPPDQLTPGLPVEVWFDDVTDEVTLPKWRRKA